MKIRRSDICRVPGFPFSAGYESQREYGYHEGHPLIRPYYRSSSLVQFYYWKKLELICSLADYDPRWVALDIGCGPGIFLPTLSSFFKEVLAVDINGDDIRIAEKVRSSLGMGNLSLFHGDMTTAPIPKDSVDIVFSIDVFEHIKDLSPTINSLYGVMKDGAILVVSAPTENFFNDFARKMMGYAKPETHYHSSEDIKNMLNDKFKLMKRRRLYSLPRAFSPAELFLFVKR